MTRPILLAVLTAAALCVGATAARAQTPTASETAQRLDAAVRATPPAEPQRSQRMEGIAQTSVEHRFAGDRVAGAVGFLCGRPDAASETGRESPLGSDPHGRFVGARLSIALR